MKDILLLILFCITVVVIVKLVIKITSFIVKLILWTGIVVAIILVVNYFVLPKLGIKSFPIIEKIITPAKEKAVTEIKTQSPKIKQEIESGSKKVVKNFLLDPLQRQVTTFIIKK